MLKKKKLINDFERSSKTYFNEISNFGPLSKEEEQSLWEQYKRDNDITARDKIVKSNLRFVASIAKGYQGLGLSYADLIAEGNYGLMKAMDKFDPTKGYKTISYSVWWIRQAILEALEKRNNIKGNDLPLDFEKPVDEKEDINLKEEENATRTSYTDDSLNAETKSIEMKEALTILLPCLTNRERKIIEEYFGCGNKDEMTLEEIGKEIGLTKERVRQIKEKALKKLRSEALKNSITSDIYNK